jgi:hypothetical protein
MLHHDSLCTNACDLGKINFVVKAKNLAKLTDQKACVYCACGRGHLVSSHKVKGQEFGGQGQELVVKHVEQIRSKHNHTHYWDNTDVTIGNLLEDLESPLHGIIVGNITIDYNNTRERRTTIHE